MSQVVWVNAGGVWFQTTKSTLSMSSFFVALMDRWSPPPQSTDAECTASTSSSNGRELSCCRCSCHRRDGAMELFVDRDPAGFELALSKMRDCRFRVPPDRAYELEYFGVSNAVTPSSRPRTVPH
ncbi:Hypothetical protein UVM_LOCUS243 [uncultured virus]|nr:Hypothetical protein UVM_LOCUS243 [uncultured virus]